MPPKLVHIQFSSIDRYLAQKQVLRITGSGCLSVWLQRIPPRKRKSGEPHCVAGSCPQGNGCVSAAASSWNQSSWPRGRHWMQSGTESPTLQDWQPETHVYWCEVMLSVDCWEANSGSHTARPYNSAQPQIAELHTPSDKSPPPPTLGMEQHRTGVKSIYLISVKWGFFLYSGNRLHKCIIYINHNLRNREKNHCARIGGPMCFPPFVTFPWASHLLWPSLVYKNEPVIIPQAVVRFWELVKGQINCKVPIVASRY